jgi:multicomponent Na+:H+ antiporter subunit D
MTKIWAAAFWSPLPEGATAGALAPRQVLLLGVPAAALGLLTVLMGIGAGPAVALAQQTAAQLLDPAAYVTAVLGAR